MAVVFTRDIITNKNTYDATYKLLVDDLDLALEDALSLSGKAPNYMTADLDMNGNDVLNAAGTGTTSDTADTVTFVATDDLSSTDVQSAIEEIESDLQTHEAATNPHSDTASTIGLGNVDNTSDADKPISDAAQAALDLKAPIDSPAFTTSLTVYDYDVLTKETLVFDEDTISVTESDGEYTMECIATINTTQLGSLTDNSTLSRAITNVQSVDFGTIATGGYVDVDVTIEGVVYGSDDASSVMVSYGSYVSYTNMVAYLTAWVSATDTVTVRAYNVTDSDADLDQKLAFCVFQGESL